MQTFVNAVQTLQHFLIVLAALGSATALAWQGTLDASQAMGVIGAALVYGGVTATPPASVPITAAAPRPPAPPTLGGPTQA